MRAFAADGSELDLLVVCAPLVMENESYLYLHFRNVTETSRLWTHVQRTEEVSATAGIISSLAGELLELMRDIRCGLDSFHNNEFGGRVDSSIRLLERLLVLGSPADESPQVHDLCTLLDEVLEMEKQVLALAE